MSVVPSFDIPQSNLSFSPDLYESLTQDYGVSVQIDPMMTYKGTLPKSGKAFTFGPIHDVGAVQPMLDLQTAVRKEAEKKGKQDFLIVRTRQEFKAALLGDDSFYGAWCNGDLIAMFKLGKHDDEKKDGRGKITPPQNLGVKTHKQVMILGAAQVHPDFANETIGLLGTAFRYQKFLDSSRDVLMTKVHQDNKDVQKNYKNAGFLPVFSTAIKSGNLTTFKADRSIIQTWTDKNTQKVFDRFDLQPQKTNYSLN
jgi:hypothetical protein